MKQAVLDALVTARAERRPVAMVTAIPGGAQWLVQQEGSVEGLTPESVAAIHEAMAADRSGTIESPEGNLFVQVHNPPLRMAIVGAVHIAQALAPMAALAGYEVTIIDPRGAFATESRFPGIALSDDWPDDALNAFAPDSRSAIVTLTHDPKLDDPALNVALKSGAFYIGSLGSRKTHAARVERLTESGFDASVIDRIHGPIGLSIGAKSPAEIAVSILAQVIEARRRPAAPRAEDRAA